MTNPMTMTMPVAVTGTHPVPAAFTNSTGAAPDGRERGCSNCGSVRSVRVLPDGRHRCDCGHRWTPTAARTVRPSTGHRADGPA
ncbi:hypothetical protein [Actinomadura geliboluensis]|uniref:Uncharacterized protein n=1 Tax=Actinomadura geliboluensis TaxID=882440 RepID=A0A5S4G331_9ACTN|nr:hypothetical protein [Actinomadura geliboluensis]TMR27359.1 hypothetical protein ETD96_39565 [Actinomadura geliboluensis]